MKLHESLAQNHSIRLQAEAETWQEAVKIGVDLLVAADVVEPRYYQAILDGVAQHWPLFCDRSGISHAARAAGRGRQKNRLCAGHAKETADFQPRR
ncbi:PTS sugar transporter subunit IIA [Klebsiella pneumoniae subsp. pneumoniae]|nr:PTS sugar transporter subunit IIA [Klebsiella pneumoniae subsp. pneumoniae]